MKFSQKTMKILKNFININQSILFKEGNELSTISPSKNIYAKAIIEETIPHDFAIYDLSRLLSVLSLFEEPDISVEDKHLVITKNYSKINFMFADIRTIIVPPNKPIKLPSVDVQFTLTPEMYSEYMKATQVLGLPELIVHGDGSKLSLRSRDTKNSTSNEYSVDIGDTDKRFEIIFNADNLKILSNTYEVMVSQKGFSLFKSDEVEYFIAIEEHSTFND